MCDFDLEVNARITPFYPFWCEWDYGLIFADRTHSRLIECDHKNNEFHKVVTVHSSRALNEAHVIFKSREPNRQEIIKAGVISLCEYNGKHEKLAISW